jgi:hypothetical protein
MPMCWLHSLSIYSTATRHLSSYSTPAQRLTLVLGAENLQLSPYILRELSFFVTNEK